MSDQPPALTRPSYPTDFRLRRGLNWVTLGLNYASFYVNRYNLSFSSKAICDSLGLNNAQYGMINTGRDWAYAVGQFVNGLFADRVGGKTAMAIGGYGTAVLNVLFGLAWYYRAAGPITTVLMWLVVIRSLDGYTQAFGAPGMVKMNAAWFSHVERGGFAGIFGLMINIGRFVTNELIPFILAGFTIWSFSLPAGNWQFAFFIPAGIVTIVTTIMLLVTANTPEEAGYVGIVPRDRGQEEDTGPLPYAVILGTILGNPLVWLTAFAYFCTGAVRSGVDQWFPKYFQEVHHLTLGGSKMQFVAWMIPIAATAGSILSGYASDLFFRGRRAPVAAFQYFTETAILLIGTRVHGQFGVMTTLILIAFTCNATHSILGAAAPMDFGGRKMAGFACGVIDSFQYIGAGLAGVFLGRLIDHFGWGAWLYFMAGFGVLGGLLMLIMWPMESRRNAHAAAMAAASAEADQSG